MSDIVTFKAHPTRYKNVLFRSRLEATWAAFFDAIAWQWEYEPTDLQINLDDGQVANWVPDFHVTFPCGHSECQPWDSANNRYFDRDGSHSLYVEVKPYRSIEEFKDHIIYKAHWGMWEPGGAMFGIDPSVSQWNMSHGAGGGTYSIEQWLDFPWEPFWAAAKNITQWRPASD